MGIVLLMRAGLTNARAQFVSTAIKGMTLPFMVEMSTDLVRCFKCAEISPWWLAAVGTMEKV